MTTDVHTDTHSLEHALTGCEHEMADITNCVLCERRLAADREHVDTCGEFCFRRLLVIQRNSYRPRDEG